MTERAKNRVEPARSKLRADFFRLDEQTFAGYVVDEGNLNRRFVVELMLDGYPLRLARADAYANELAIEGLGDGCYGFSFTVSDRDIEQGFIVEARLANIGTAVGEPVALKAPGDQASRLTPLSELSWLGGLRFEGWCIADRENAPVVSAVIDGEVVAEAKATQWANVGTREDPKLARRFDLHLPERFADGRIKRVRFLRENGEDFPGSPVTIVAFYDGLRQAIDRFSDLESERPRSEQFDRMLPMAMPFTAYAHWLERFPVGNSSSGEAASMAVVLVGPGDPEPSLESLRSSDVVDWVAAALPEAEGQSAFDAEDLQKFLIGDAEKSDYVVFALSGSYFETTALRRIAAAFAEFPDAVAVYGDFDIDNRDGKRWPIALPAFDYERTIEQGYCAHLFALRRNTALDAAAAGRSDLYRLFMSAIEPLSRFRDAVVHIPGSLAILAAPNPALDDALLARAVAEHLGARKIGAQIAESSGNLFPAARILRSAPPGRTTVIIPVRNQKALLESCLRSIEPAVASGNADVLIVDNDSSDSEMISYLNSLNGSIATVIRVPGPFNFAHLNNVAADSTRSEFLCLLNNDVKATDREWLRDMLSRMREDDVGAVGALLLWPSGVVQHGSTVLGPSFAAAHAFNERFHTDPGYADLLCVAHECSAVTAACMLTRRRDYLDVGGMDEVHFPVNFNDVDYCLKLRAMGKRIVFTPHARLLHLESASRGQDESPDRAGRFAYELQNLRARWGEHLIADPYYSPVLSLDPIPFSALAWPPRPRDARRNTAPTANDIPPGF